MAVHGSGNSMMVHNSGPSMLVAHAGAGPNMVGPLQDKLNRLLLNANSPAKSSGHGSLIAAGRYDNLSASLSQSVKVRCLSTQTCLPMLTAVPDLSWQPQASACILMINKTIKHAVRQAHSQFMTVKQHFVHVDLCSLARHGYINDCLCYCALQQAVKPMNCYALLVLEALAEHHFLLIIADNLHN